MEPRDCKTMRSPEAVDNTADTAFVVVVVTAVNIEDTVTAAFVGALSWRRDFFALLQVLG